MNGPLDIHFVQNFYEWSYFLQKNIILSTIWCTLNFTRVKRIQFYCCFVEATQIAVHTEWSATARWRTLVKKHAMIFLRPWIWSSKNIEFVNASESIYRSWYPKCFTKKLLIKPYSIKWGWSNVSLLRNPEVIYPLTILFDHLSEMGRSWIY